MKAFTDILQSKKLAEFLPIESADMHYSKDYDGRWFVDLAEYTSVKIPKYVVNVEEHLLPCWSLAALLNVISKHSSRLEIILRVDKKYNIFANFDNFIVFRKFVDIDNAIDVCVDMIETLHEQKLL